ncbi:MAG: ATP-binding protein [Myxococcales bacterium]|nr:ATP-binding protein [Myxococcales bacterium]
MARIDRPGLRRAIEGALRDAPVVALLGPRQSGKTTIAREIAARRQAEHFDLEDPRDEQRLAAPATALEALTGLVVIDEIQRRPELFPVLRVLADRRPTRARFLVLGSASPELLRQSSESLAGRIRFIEMAGFSLAEVGASRWRRLLLRGGFPASFLARSEAASAVWREDFIRTFVERDVTALGIEVRSRANLRRLWTMLAHRHGQVWNGAELAGALGESYPTVKRHLDILVGALVVRELPPWLPNLEKRLVKSPKVYVRDTGLLHALLGLRSFRELEGHPKLGASWEGFVLERIARAAGERNTYFWATHGGAELDVLVVRGARKLGFEVKWGDAPAMTRSMHQALADLGLERLSVVYPGPKRYRLAPRVEVVPVTELDELLHAL